MTVYIGPTQVRQCIVVGYEIYRYMHAKPIQISKKSVTDQRYVRISAKCGSLWRGITVPATIFSRPHWDRLQEQQWHMSSPWCLLPFGDKKKIHREPKIGTSNPQQSFQTRNMGLEPTTLALEPVNRRATRYHCANPPLIKHWICVEISGNF